VEKVGMTNTGIVQYAIRLRCFWKHKLKYPKGKKRKRKKKKKKKKKTNSVV
jgi:hypothetical protein